MLREHVFSLEWWGRPKDKWEMYYRKITITEKAPAWLMFIRKLFKRDRAHFETEIGLSGELLIIPKNRWLTEYEVYYGEAYN